MKKTKKAKEITEGLVKVADEILEAKTLRCKCGEVDTQKEGSLNCSYCGKNLFYTKEEVLEGLRFMLTDKVKITGPYQEIIQNTINFIK